MLHSYEYDLDTETLTFRYTEPLTSDDRELAKSIILDVLPPRMEGKPSGEIRINWICREMVPRSQALLNQKALDAIPAMRAAAQLLVMHSRTGPVPMHELVSRISGMYHVPLSVGSRVVVELVSEGALILNPDRTLDIPEPTPL